MTVSIFVCFLEICSIENFNFIGTINNVWSKFDCLDFDFWLQIMFCIFHVECTRMPQTSTESIRCGSRLFEPADFRRLFKYLPMNVLRRYTNIEQLIIAEYKKKHKKPPPGIHINKAIEKYHKEISELDDWNASILGKLDFNWSSKDKTYVIKLSQWVLFDWLIR